MADDLAECQPHRTRPTVRLRLTETVSRPFVLLSGLPASGKTTLARPLSSALGLPLLDKDDILESLFDSLGVSSPQERSRLSRASDGVLQDVASASQGAVLSSFWRCESLSTTSGTPTEWLRLVPDATVVEVLCECPPRRAAERYVARRRHPGHHDDHKPLAELVRQFEQLAAAGPLGIGSLLRVDTTTEVDVEGLAQDVRRSCELPSR